jgi:hypothetical protein
LTNFVYHTARPQRDYPVHKYVPAQLTVSGVGATSLYNGRSSIQGICSSSASPLAVFAAFAKRLCDRHICAQDPSRPYGPFPVIAVTCFYLKSSSVLPALPAGHALAPLIGFLLAQVLLRVTLDGDHVCCTVVSPLDRRDSRMLLFCGHAVRELAKPPKWR